MGENSIKKEIMISVRIDGQTAEVINASAEHYDLSRSELIRKAAISYVSLNVENPQFPNPKLFFSHNMLKILFKAATTETIKAVAQQSFLNGKRDFRFFKELTTGEDPTLSPNFSKENYTTSMIENVFSKNGQNWFDKIKYSHSGDRISFSGKHDMGENFSLFIKELLSLYMNEMDYEIKNAQTRKIKYKDSSKRNFDYLRYEFYERR